MKWSPDFCTLFCWYGLSQLLTYKCWTDFASCDEFQEVLLDLIFQHFVENFHLCLSRILVYSFLLTFQQICESYIIRRETMKNINKNFKTIIMLFVVKFLSCSVLWSKPCITQCLSSFHSGLLTWSSLSEVLHSLIFQFISGCWFSL